MFQKDKWPFTPTCLGDLIDRDTLSVVQSGCCERLGRPLIIFDNAPQTRQFSNPIEAINLRQRFESFCSTFREKVSGGEQACRRCNLENAGTSSEIQQTGAPFRTFECHLGLQEATYIEVEEYLWPSSGQYLPSDGSAPCNKGKQVGAVAMPICTWTMTRGKAIVPGRKATHGPPISMISCGERRSISKDLLKPNTIRTKYRWEQQFLDMLRTPASSYRTAKLEHLRQDVRELLEQIRTFCRCEYVVFFASVQESDGAGPYRRHRHPPDVEKKPTPL